MRQSGRRNLIRILMLAGLLPALIACSTTPKAKQEAQVSFRPAAYGMIIKISNPGPGVVRLAGKHSFGPIFVQVRVSDDSGRPYFPRPNEGDPWWTPSMSASSYFRIRQPIVIKPGSAFSIPIHARELTEAIRPEAGFRSETCRFQFRASVQHFGEREPRNESESEWVTAPCVALFPRG